MNNKYYLIKILFVICKYFAVSQTNKMQQVCDFTFQNITLDTLKYNALSMVLESQVPKQKLIFEDSSIYILNRQKNYYLTTKDTVINVCCPNVGIEGHELSLIGTYEIFLNKNKYLLLSFVDTGFISSTENVYSFLFDISIIRRIKEIAIANQACVSPLFLNDFNKDGILDMAYLNLFKSKYQRYLVDFFTLVNYKFISMNKGMVVFETEEGLKYNCLDLPIKW